MRTWRERPAWVLVVALVCAPAWGQSANEVRDLQRVLNSERSGVGLSALAEDGVLGPRTRAAIRNLQRHAGLPITGVADRATLSVAHQGRRVAVRDLQEALNRERVASGQMPIGVDGKFGNQTLRAVGDFQRRRGLPWTGRLDARTRAALANLAPLGSSSTAGMVGALTGATTLASGGPELRRGARRKVSLLQTRLNDYRRAQGQPPIGVDGAFGLQTERALKQAQTALGLSASGVADARTWDALVAATANGPLGPVNPAAYPVSGSRYKRANSGDADVEIHLLDPLSIGGEQRTPLVYESRMTIDADGAGNAWTTDPWGQPTTSLTYPNGTSLDPTRINYTVLPIGFEARHPGVRLGDVVAVVYRGKVAYAIYGDRGPRGKIGEGSIRLARELGIPSSPIHGGASGGVQYVVFPRSGTGRPLSQAELDRRGERLLRAAGGRP